MRIVTYNIVLGFDGQRIIPNLFHALAYILGSTKAVKYWSKYASKHIDFALGFNPDILCINEVLPDIFGDLLEQKLSKAGFRTIISGIVEHHPSPLRIATCLAVKWEGQQIDFANPYRR